jgi:predicted phosphodiesterase
MKIQIFSDLHFEFFNSEIYELGKIKINPEADVVVLAGDIDNADLALKKALEINMEFGKHVIFVPGNHEFYGQQMHEILNKYKNKYDGVTVLTGLKEYSDISTVIKNVRFVGGTLWTDFKLYENSKRMPTQEDALNVGSVTIRDFSIIKYGEHTFCPEDSLDLHKKMLANIIEAIDDPFEGKTVLITHHGVHLQSVVPKYWADSRYLNSKKKLPGENQSWMMNPCFTSNLPELISKVNIAIHGHTHESLDYMIGNTRVIANPRGYPLSCYGDLIQYENSNYQNCKLIEI